jgi:hypothetical protein
MNREEAYSAMVKGNKVTHNGIVDYFYYELKDGKVIARDGVDETSDFWSTDWMDRDWKIWNPNHEIE